MNCTLKQLVKRFALVVAVYASAHSLHVFAQTTAFPEKPVRIVVPFTPGGSNDVIARVVGQKLAQYWGQAVVVDNRPGAGGNIGSKEVAKSAPDGYTLLVVANSFVINPHLYTPGKAGYDAFKEFAPVGKMGIAPIILVGNPSVKATNVKELIALAKSRAGKMTYASAGVGTPHHLSAELFKNMTGTDLVHIPYRGAVPAVTDVVGGQVDVMFGVSNTVLPQVRAGGLKAFGVAGSKRLAAFPQIPTVAESGVPGFDSEVWLGLVAPVGTPANVIQKINADVKRALSDDGVKKSLSTIDIEVSPSSPSELATLMKADDIKWAKVVKDTGATVD